MAMQQHRFRVVFVKFDPRKDLDRTKEGMRQRFKLPPSILSRFLMGRPVVVKNNIDAETAYHYKTNIEQLGGICRIEPIPLSNDVDEKGFLERRKSERRIRNQRRRTARPGAIQPDRRGRDRRRPGKKGSRA